MSKLYVKAIKSAVFGIIAFAALIFLPAGTLNYWQGWAAFLATFVFSTLVVTVYLARHDPKLLEQRISAGTQAEKELARCSAYNPHKKSRPLEGSESAKCRNFRNLPRV